MFVATPLAALFLSLGVAFYLPNIYESKAVLAPKSSGGSSDLARLASQYGGLASLAGINVSGLGDESGNRARLALEVVKGHKFFGEQLYDLMLLELMAVDHWESQSNILIYDNDVYDQALGVWTRDVDYPYKVVPSSQEAHQKFIEEVLQVSEDGQTGMISISVRHESPNVARAWVEMIVGKLNSSIRTADIRDAERAIEYLTAKVAETELVALKEVFTQLIEEQTKTIFLANVSEDYVFTMVDDPVSPEEEVSPKRILLITIGCFLSIMSTGVMLGLRRVTQ